MKQTEVKLDGDVVQTKPERHMTKLTELPIHFAIDNSGSTKWNDCLAAEIACAQSHDFLPCGTILSWNSYAQKVKSLAYIRSTGGTDPACLVPLLEDLPLGLLLLVTDGQIEFSSMENFRRNMKNGKTASIDFPAILVLTEKIGDADTLNDLSNVNMSISDPFLSCCSNVLIVLNDIVTKKRFIYDGTGCFEGLGVVSSVGIANAIGQGKEKMENNDDGANVANIKIHDFPEYHPREVLENLEVDLSPNAFIPFRDDFVISLEALHAFLRDDDGLRSLVDASLGDRVEGLQLFVDVVRKISNRVYLPRIESATLKQALKTIKTYVSSKITAEIKALEMEQFKCVQLFLTKKISLEEKREKFEAIEASLKPLRALRASPVVVELFRFISDVEQTFSGYETNKASFFFESNRAKDAACIAQEDLEDFGRCLAGTCDVMGDLDSDSQSDNDDDDDDDDDENDENEKEGKAKSTMVKEHALCLLFELPPSVIEHFKQSEAFAIEKHNLQSRAPFQSKRRQDQRSKNKDGKKGKGGVQKKKEQKKKEKEEVESIETFVSLGGFLLPSDRKKEQPKGEKLDSKGESCNKSGGSNNNNNKDNNNEDRSSGNFSAGQERMRAPSGGLGPYEDEKKENLDPVSESNESNLGDECMSDLSAEEERNMIARYCTRDNLIDNPGLLGSVLSEATTPGVYCHEVAVKFPEKNPLTMRRVVGVVPLSYDINVLTKHLCHVFCGGREMPFVVRAFISMLAKHLHKHEWADTRLRGYARWLVEKYKVRFWLPFLKTHADFPGEDSTYGEQIRFVLRHPEDCLRHMTKGEIVSIVTIAKQLMPNFKLRFNFKKAQAMANFLPVFRTLHDAHKQEKDMRLLHMQVDQLQFCKEVNVNLEGLISTFFWEAQCNNNHAFRLLKFQKCLDAAFLDEKYGEVLWKAYCGQEVDYSQFCLQIPDLPLPNDDDDDDCEHDADLHFDLTKTRMLYTQVLNKEAPLDHVCVYCGTEVKSLNELETHLKLALGVHYLPFIDTLRKYRYKQDLDPLVLFQKMFAFVAKKHGNPRDPILHTQRVKNEIGLMVLLIKLRKMEEQQQHVTREKVDREEEEG